MPFSCSKIIHGDAFCLQKSTTEEVREARLDHQTTIRNWEKVQPYIPEATSQHTGLLRRIKALQISVDLITKELETYEE